MILAARVSSACDIFLYIYIRYSTQAQIMGVKTRTTATATKTPKFFDLYFNGASTSPFGACSVNSEGIATVLVHRTKAREVFWEFDPIIMQNMNLRVRFFDKIRERVMDPRRIGSRYIKGTEESFPRVDLSVPVIHRDPSDLGSMIRFRIFPKKRTFNLLLFCAPTWPSYHVIENHQSCDHVYWQDKS